MLAGVSPLRQQILLILLAVNSAYALIRNVPQDHSTIQAAIDFSLSGDTILVSPGTWSESITIQNKSLSLFSYYTVTSDSGDINETMIDGSGISTCVFVDNDLQDSLHISGFTITGGLGHYDINENRTIGGGVHIEDFGYISISNTVFRSNTSNSNGSSLYYQCSDFPVDYRVVELSNINCYNDLGNTNESTTRSAFTILNAAKITAHKLRISTSDVTISRQYYLAACDSLIVSNIVADGLDSLVSDPFRFSTSCPSWPHSKALVARDVTISNCNVSNTFNSTFHIGDNGTLSANNIVYENNIVQNNALRAGVAGSGRIDYDSLFIVGNSIVKSHGVLNSEVRGDYRNVFILENTFGSDTPFHVSHTTGSNVVLNANLRNVLFDSNTYIVPPNPDAEFSRGGSFLYIGADDVDSLFIHNLRFTSNSYIDNDEYVVEEMQGGDIDHIRSNRRRLPSYLELDSCIFANNIQTNVVPEVEDQFAELVGSNIEFWDLDGNTHQAVFVKNTVMVNCNDGGLYCVTDNGEVVFENLQLRNIGRYGLSISRPFESNSIVRLRNVIIDSIYHEESYSNYPYHFSEQYVLQLLNFDNQSVSISNVNLTRCSTNILLSILADEGSVNIENTIATGNFTGILYRPQFDTAMFSYSFLQDDLIGENCIYGSNPDYHAEHGYPYLSAESMCIDGGCPTSDYNDSEDPANPGWALWPSQGGLRNDIGYTGGPLATVSDTSWVHVDPRLPEDLPERLQFESLYPNPFNATSKVSYKLDHPAEITLKVYNILGQEMASLVRGMHQAGRHSITIDGSNWASGVYVLTLRTKSEVRTRKMLLLK
jgi:hypothetical protein